MFTDEDQILLVVVNDEGQYSIWPADRDLPAGWTDAGFRGVKSDCLAHIETVWTDIRPLGARSAHAGGPDQPAEPDAGDGQLDGQLLERVGGLVATVLDRAEVGPDDDFFALGGHSLSAGRLISLVKRDLDVRVALIDFFDAPTVRGLCRLVEARRAAAPA